MQPGPPRVTALTSSPGSANKKGFYPDQQDLENPSPPPQRPPMLRVLPNVLFVVAFVVAFDEKLNLTKLASSVARGAKKRPL